LIDHNFNITFTQQNLVLTKKTSTPRNQLGKTNSIIVFIPHSTGAHLAKVLSNWVESPLCSQHVAVVVFN